MTTASPLGTEDEPADRVDHRRHGLVLGERAQRPGHRLDGHVRARQERERDEHGRQPLGLLRAAGDEPEGDEHPGEREAAGDVRALAGLDPAPLEFLERYGALLRRVVRSLAPAGE